MTKRKEFLILLLCLLAGFALRFYTFDQKSLWMDEIHTFNDSRDDLKGQLKFYKENPTYFHPPLFFILTHLFYPFQHPERDLRIIPLIFGTLSIPMIYLLARSFSPLIALPCTVSLTFMAYHISLSQDGRSYSLLMFLAIVALYFFLQHLRTFKKSSLFMVALLFAILFHTSYSSIPFMIVSQILWFYRVREDSQKPSLSSFLILNGLVLFMCAPWIAFLAFDYRGQAMAGLYSSQDPVSLLDLIFGILHDWVPYTPLSITSGILLVLVPFVSKNKKNAILLLSVFIGPIAGVYLSCSLFNVSHFVTSRYFINFLPLFFITLFLSLNAIEKKFEKVKYSMRFKLLFLILFVASNLVILPLYYRSEKQDYRGLVNYLKSQLREGDKIVVGNPSYIPVMLHYFQIYPNDRHHVIPVWRVSENEYEHRIGLIYQKTRFTILSSRSYWFKYLTDGSRLWLVADRENAIWIKQRFSCTPKGYFDGSFLNMTRFPMDVSLYLFLCNPNSPQEKGIDMQID
jgi:hypothetical protein